MRGSIAIVRGGGIEAEFAGAATMEVAEAYISRQPRAPQGQGFVGMMGRGRILRGAAHACQMRPSRMTPQPTPVRACT